VERTIPSSNPLRPSRVGAIAIYLAFAAIMMQTLIRVTNSEALYWYGSLSFAYFLLYSLALWRTKPLGHLIHIYFAFQSIIIIKMLSLDPEIDVVTGLFSLLLYQVATLLRGHVRRLWLGIIISLTLGSLMFYMGALQGLAYGMTPAAAGIALAFLVIANQEIETARTKSQALITKLESSHLQLQAYTGQVEELATLEERNRLLRELHDTVSQTIFSISLTTRAAQILLEQRSEQVKPYLEELQTMTNNALSELRSMVVRLRPEAE
jgi:signal transduction histidine kinase